MVIGTTGFNEQQKQHIINLAKSSPILLSSNMSLGVNICKYLIASFSKLWSKYQAQNPPTVISRWVFL
jgi:4-hydroxy-tetrahydrodipicolinate reductase